MTFSATTPPPALSPAGAMTFWPRWFGPARRLKRTDDDLSDHVFTDATGRVAKGLLQLARRIGVPEGDALRVVHNLTQTEIAQLAGLSRETVSKSMADFARGGWIRVDGPSV